MAWHHWLRAELDGTLDLFFPSVCLVCRAGPVTEKKAMLCRPCSEQLPQFTGSSCVQCALPFVTASGNHLCENCLRSSPHFEAIAFHGLFRGLLRDSVHRFKYHQDITLARTLGTLVTQSCSDAIERHVPDLILPVPLHRQRLRRRGYNQALILAVELQRALAVPLAQQGLLRVRPTATQQGLDADSRRRNVCGAFVVDENLVRGRRILLVDDVMTTGATLSECSKVLRQAGSGAVMATIVARVDREPDLSFE